MSTLALILAVVCFLMSAFGMPDTWGVKLEGLGLAFFALSFLLPQVVGYVNRRGA